MPRAERTLSEEFLDFMGEHWPTPKSFQGWMRKHHDGIRNGIYSQMITGNAVKPTYVVRLVDFFFANAKAKLHAESAALFFEYLRSKGVGDPMSQSPAQLADKLLQVDEDDYLQKGISGILDAFRGSRFVEAYTQGCKEKDIPEVIRWLFITVGRDADPRQAPDSIEAAINAAEERMQITMDQYTELALRWWAYDQWTVVRARGTSSAIGMTAILPLKSDTYQSLRRGELAVKDLNASHLQRPSRHLLIEAVSERPVDAGGNNGNVTRRLLASVFSQGSILSHCYGKEAKQPLHILTRAGTPKNGRRATSLSYKKTGNSFRGETCDMLERVFKWPFSPDELIFIGLSGAIGNYSDRFLIPPAGPYSKKRTPPPPELGLESD